ncbi:MAG TPA: hypothetical protein VK696_03190 [Steroidobacteraceae bacterium]|jgi:hypothetical protein|nr:hypothetical protein [Steroidobacteraceae bacterium]
MSFTQWSRVLSVAAIAAWVGAGCSSKPQTLQSQYDARLRHGQPEQQADAAAERKADRADKAKQKQREERLGRLETYLAARRDADSLAAAALFERVVAGFTGPDSHDLASRAAAAAPLRADLTFLQLQLCASDPDCDSQPLEARLRQLDPDNGVTWTYALLRADRANDEAGRKTGRDGLARAKRVDVYWNRLVSHLTAAAAGHAGFDTSAAMIEVIGIEAAFPTALQPVSRACSETASKQPEVLTECRQIANAFRKGDTTLFELYGSSLAVRLWPAGSPEGLEIATERRTLHYRSDLMTRNAAKVNSDGAARTLAAMYVRYPTEQTAFRALFIDLGLNPDPPAGWVDRWPGG